MYDAQSNNARFIYTLSLRPKRDDHVRMSNGFYFSKVTRSDEKLIYTERDMTSIVRTVLFMHVFRLAPCESVKEAIYGGRITYPVDGDITVRQTDLTIGCMRDIVDSVLGERFCTVVSRPLVAVYSEYKYAWRYYGFGHRVALPSAVDIVRLYRFVNLPRCELSPATRFVLSNGDDHKVPLQGRVKRLPL